MSLPEAMTVLVTEWDDVQRRLDPGQAGRLRELAARFAAERDSVGWANTAERIMDLLTGELPLSHPVLRALMATHERFRDRSGPPADRAWSRVAEAVADRLEAPAASYGGVGRRGPPGVPFDDPDDEDAGGPAGYPCHGPGDDD